MNQIPVIPDTAPFDAAQRVWLNGFLAGLFAQSETSLSQSPNATAAAAIPLLVLYGSQTGTAERLARRFASEASRRGFAPRVLEASSGPSLEWTKEARLMIVTSTYGDGEMPDNAKTFWDWIQTDAAKVLNHVRYAVLALGDSNYEHFCAAGRKIDERLEVLGAQRMHPRADCDMDYEPTSKSWIDAALSVLGGQDGSRPSESGATEASAEAKTLGQSKESPINARLLVNRVLSNEGSAKEVRHFEISLGDSGLGYEAGDALGIWPANCPALVSDLLTLLGYDGEEAVPLPGGGEISLRKALTNHYDITKSSKELLQEIGQHYHALGELLVPTRKDELNQWLYGREVVDLLEFLPKTDTNPAQLVRWLKPLAPRLYSICSSPKAHPGQVHLTVNIVRHTSHARARKGVCSTFLADRSDSVEVPIFLQKSPNFRLPIRGDAPVIMVGPGTGVAPFRAFLHERQASGASGRNWLFFGEQRAATDFYYQNEFEQMLSCRHLTKLSTAFSRDQANKIYVQDRMLAEAATLWSWLQDGAHFYVCGDASRMAKDVETALHRVVEIAGGRNSEEARAYVQQLRTEKRYQRDVY